jgi:uncharacterized protein
MRFLFSLIFLISMNVSGAELQLPSLSSPVMDMAGFLTEAERKDLSELAYEINTNNGPQITILTVNDMQEYPIEEFSIRVAEKWQLGTKEKDNGLLVVIAKAERQMRIEVGNGIEGEVTDYDTTKYTKELFPQYFKNGQFHAGLRIFMEDMAAKFNIKLNEGGNRIVRRAPQRAANNSGNFIIMAILGILAFGSMLFNKRPMARGLFTGAGFTGVSLLMGIPVLMMIFVFVIGLILGLVGIGNFLTALAMSGGGRGGSGFGGGGGGGGWSGGGGGFSGGGSSGSW